TRTDEYEIELDTTKWTPEAIKAWSLVFNDAEGPEDIACILAERIARDGLDTPFQEGFGNVKRFLHYQGDTHQQLDKDVEDYNPTISVVAYEIGQYVAEVMRTCRKCGCTEYDCSNCVERTGEPCHWVEYDLCSACVKDKDD